MSNSPASRRSRKSECFLIAFERDLTHRRSNERFALDCAVINSAVSTARRLSRDRTRFPANDMSPTVYWRHMLQVSRAQSTYDAIVVGSGATGGWAAKELTEAGMRVALLEAGKPVSPKDFTEHVQSWQLKYLGFSPKIREDRPIQSNCYACTEYNSRVVRQRQRESVHTGEAV